MVFTSILAVRIAANVDVVRDVHGGNVGKSVRGVVRVHVDETSYEAVVKECHRVNNIFMFFSYFLEGKNVIIYMMTFFENRLVRDFRHVYPPFKY